MTSERGHYEIAMDGAEAVLAAFQDVDLAVALTACRNAGIPGLALALEADARRPGNKLSPLWAGRALNAAGREGGPELDEIADELAVAGEPWATLGDAVRDIRAWWRDPDPASAEISTVRKATGI